MPIIPALWEAVWVCEVSEHVRGCEHVWGCECEHMSESEDVCGVSMCECMRMCVRGCEHVCVSMFLRGV